jgi:hypothetical protein
MDSVLPPLAFVILGKGDFQRSLDGVSQANKADHVLRFLKENLGWRVLVVPHVESKGLPKHEFDRLKWEFFERCLVAARLIWFFFVRVFLGEGFSSTTARLAWGEARAWLWNRRFQKNRPDAVFGIGLTAQEIKAAKNLGVKTFEIQHGVFEKEAVQFYWPTQAPDFMCLWPTSDSHLLQGSGIRPIGIPSYKLLATTTYSFGTGLLVPLSWGEVWQNGPTPFFGSLPERVDALIRGSSRLLPNIMFRIHPVTPKKVIRRLNKELRTAFPGAIVESAAKRNIEDFILRGSAVILERSTVWLDALQLSVPVMTVSPEHLRVMRESVPQSSHGLLFLVESEDEVERTTSRNLRSSSAGQIDHIGSSASSWAPLESVLVSLRRDAGKKWRADV